MFRRPLAAVAVAVATFLGTGGPAHSIEHEFRRPEIVCVNSSGPIEGRTDPIECDAALERPRATRLADAIHRRRHPATLARGASTPRGS